MNLRTIQTGLAAAAMSTILLASPAESHAIFHWLSRCCGGGSSTPTYGAAPLYGTAPAAADPCCAPPQVTQTASYVPQTCYRTQYVNVPVTTYRPVVSRDPCTGCPVTCLRPTTSYVQQAQLVPYTTYRRVLSNPCCGAAAPAVTAGYAPTYSAPASYAAGSSCSGCSAGTAMTYAPAASAPYYSGTTYGNTTSSTFVSPSNGSSSANGLSNGVPTLAPSNGAPYQQQRPIPKVEAEKPAEQPAGNGDDGTSGPGTASGAGATLSPRLFQPNDRTTSYPILRARIHRPVSYNEPTPPAAATPRPAVVDGGWRPSTR